MSTKTTISLKAIVAPFYRQYAALFAFIIFIMFLVVGTADGAGLLDYHLALMKGVLQNAGMLIPVIVLWLFYGFKCQQFVRRTFSNREFHFLVEMNRLSYRERYWLLVFVHLLLMMPIWSYAIIMFTVGLYYKWYLPASGVLLFVFFVVMGGARRSLFLLSNPGFDEVSGRRKLWARRIYYWSFFIKSISIERKWLFAGIKLYSAGALYFFLSKSHFEDKTDLQLVYLFYSFGVLGHGVLIHQLRKMEDERLDFYRGLPVPLFTRWLQYATLYLVLFLPEAAIIFRHDQVFPHWFEAPRMVFFGYSMLLLLNSILFVRHFKMSNYLKIVIAIFLLVYLAVLADTRPFLAVTMFLGSILLFVRCYYRYERLSENME